MTPTQDSAQPSIGLKATWTIRERDKNGIIVVERTVRNIFTSYGLTALASALGGIYTYPQYLVIEDPGITLYQTIAAGATSVQLSGRADQSGDTQIVLGAGLSTQETCTFSAVAGSGPYTYTLSTGTANAHNAGEFCCRQVASTDTMSNVANEQQYDSVNDPNLRMQSAGGYSSGTGSFTMQFYFPGGSGNVRFIICGLSDSQTVGAGNLHNHFVLGTDHTSTSNDLEIDGVITLTNV